MTPPVPRRIYANTDTELFCVLAEDDDSEMDWVNFDKEASSGTTGGCQLRNSMRRYAAMSYKHLKNNFKN